MLGLKGTLSLYNYAGAFATYQAYLDAGARGANRREVEKVIAERSGFERWTGQVTVVNGETARLTVTLVEKPSLLTVRVAQPGARMTVDDATYDASTTVSAGAHRVQATAHKGEPVELDVTLTPLVPIQLSPPGAGLALDGKAITIEDSGIAVPPGAHILVASAKGFHDRRVEIPAARSDDSQTTVALPRDILTTLLDRLSTRRKVAFAVGGVGLGAMASGVVLGLQSRRFDHDTYARCPSPSEPCHRTGDVAGLDLP